METLIATSSLPDNFIGSITRMEGAMAGTIATLDGGARKHGWMV